MLSLEVLEYCSRLSKNVEEKASCWLDGVQGDKCAIKSQYFSLLSLFALWCIVYPPYTYVLQNKHKNGRRGAFTISLYRFPCRTDKICISSLFIKNDTSKTLSLALSRSISLPAGRSWIRCAPPPLDMSATTYVWKFKLFLRRRRDAAARHCWKHYTVFEYLLGW